MPADWLPSDWSAPWWDGVRAQGARVAALLAQGLPLHQALDAAWDEALPPGGAPVRFVPQSTLPEGQAYEAYLWQQRECPTRDNAHDLFNGLVWMRFPRTKRRINELQAAEIARDGVRSVRGPVRDALTLLDENGALLLAPPAVRPVLMDALQARQWQRLFVELRPLWSQARLVILGHALLEKLCQPRKDLTAHVWCAPLPAAASDTPGFWCDDAAVDAAWADSLASAMLAGKPFAPLPVLGVPFWWPANADPAFYDDATVFRAARRPP